MTWLLLGLAIAAEVSATMMLRASEGLRHRIWLGPIAVGYAAAFACLSLALSGGMPLGVAYGTWSAVGVALTALLGRWIFREPLTPTMLLGIVMIGAGVLCVELGSHAY